MKKTAYFTLLAAMATLATACSTTGSTHPDTEDHVTTNTDQTHDDIELTATQLKTVGITLGPVEQRQMSSVIRANGMLAVDPQDAAEVSPLIAGIIKQISVIEGQAVKAGQTVAYLENTDIVSMQQSYLTAVEEAALASAELKRQQALNAQGAGVLKNLQQAEAASQMADTKKSALRQQLVQIGIDPSRISDSDIATRIPVRAPISGIINKINARTGSFADMQTPLMTIANNSALYCNLRVFEQDVNLVNHGQTVDIQLTNQPDITLHGSVAAVNRSMNPENKSIDVRVKLTSDSHAKASLIPGMAVTGMISRSSDKTEALPDDAIVAAEGHHYIFVLESKTPGNDGDTLYHFARMQVIPGVSQLGYTGITPSEPLREGATAVTSNAFYIASMAADHGEHTH